MPASNGGRVRLPLLPLLLLLAVLTWPPGCRRSEQKSGGAPPPPGVSVARPVVREVVDMDEYVGRIDAVDSVDVRARVSGYLDSVHFKDGSIVSQGDLLFVIDPRPYQAQLDLTTAQFDNAQAQVQLSEIELQRNKEALPTHAISQQDYDRAFFTLRSNQAQLAAAKANADLARLNVQWCRVMAPIRGRIGRHMVTPGNLIVGGGAAEGTLLTNITSLDPIYCYIDADEQAVLKYRRMAIENQRVSARDARIPCDLILSDGSAYPFPGYIDYVSNRLDPSTGTLQARGVFPNPDRVLEPGMFGRLRVAGSGPRRVILVADQAVGTNQNQRYVLAVGPDDKVQVRSVEVGGLFHGLREVKAGLNADERVVVEGLLRARPGGSVTPTEVPMPVLRVAGATTREVFPTTTPAAATTAPVPRPTTTAAVGAPTTAPAGGRR